MQSLVCIIGLTGGLMITLALQEGKSLAAEKPAVKQGVHEQLLRNPASIPQLIKTSKISAADIPNPHWQDNACHSCHKGKPSRTNLRLRERNANKLCNNCHEVVWPHSYIHPVGMKPSRTMRKRMSRSFRRALSKSGGTVSCTTCHDLAVSCRNKKNDKTANPLFFRDAAIGKPRTELCYECHDRKSYRRLNPHDQISKSGKVNTKTCHVCHDSVPDVNTVSGIEDVGFNVKQNLSSMCMGCHPWKPHPGGSFIIGSGKLPDHLVVPSKYVQRKISQTRKTKQISFPLEPGTGKVFCATCHNPHEKGLIKNVAAAKGADSNKRLRQQKICIYCHDK